MVKDLILEETSKLHNKALAHITTLCKYIHHPDIGQRLCVLYKNAIISILNNGKDEYTGGELKAMMVGIGEIKNIVDTDRAKHNGKTYHKNLTAAFSTDLNEVERENATFTMTLYRALGINKNASGALPAKTLMEQVHRALQLQNQKEFVTYVKTTPLVQSSQKYDDEIKGGPASLLETAKKIPEVVNIRKLFYRNNFCSDAQKKPGHAKERVILMHEKEIKEQLNRITRNISTTSNADELMHVSNALGITSIPFNVLVANSSGQPTLPEFPKATASSTSSLATEIETKAITIYGKKITSHKLEDKPSDSDIQKAFECIASYKELEKESKKMNSESMRRMSVDSTSLWNSHGWLRTSIVRYVYGIPAQKFQTIDVTRTHSEEINLLPPEMYWDKTSSRLNKSNNVPFYGLQKTDGTADTTIYVNFDIVQHIHHDQFVKDHGWLTVLGIKKVVNPTEHEDDVLKRYDPRSDAQKAAATAAKTAAAAARAAAANGMEVDGSSGEAAEAALRKAASDEKAKRDAAARGGVGGGAGGGDIEIEEAPGGGV
jgi:hypothetical protein